MTLVEAVAALGRAELRHGESARLEIYAEPGRATVYAIGVRSGIHYGIVDGLAAELARMLGEVVGQVESWRPPRGA